MRRSKLRVGIVALLFRGTPAWQTGVPVILQARPFAVASVLIAAVLRAIAAQNEIGIGKLWKIYIRATDPDGDIDADVVDRPDKGSFAAEATAFQFELVKPPPGDVEVLDEVAYADQAVGCHGLVFFYR